MDKICYTDVDLTLLDFNAPFEDFLRERGVPIPHGATEGQAHLPDCFDISPEEAAKLVQEFFLDPTFGDLPPIAGSQKAVQRLHSEGWEFVAVTACPEYVESSRKENLRKVFGIEFLDVHYVGVGGCKKELLKTFRPTIWVEDHIGHAQTGHDLGFQTFLINHLHNLDKPTPAIRVDTWDEIVEHLV